MKRHRVLVTIGVLALTFLSAQIAGVAEAVWFGDPNLEYVIRDVLDSWLGAIDDTELLTIKTIVAAEKGIRNLSGLEHCVNATFLDLSYNALTDIAPIASLSALSFLSVYENQIVDISPLASLAELGVVWLDFNEIDDISALAHLTKLVGVYLKSNLISDISVLAAIPEIRILDLTNNAIGDVSPLAGLTKIERLRLFGNSISDLTPLATLTSVFELTLGTLGVEPAPVDLTPIWGMERLSRLLISSIELPSLEPLRRLGYLTELNVLRAGLTDIAAVSAMTKLRLLGLSGNPIEDISPLLDMPSLEIVWLLDTGVTRNDGSPAAAVIAALEAEGVTVILSEDESEGLELGPLVPGGRKYAP
ncbi:leucine-rich repeat domain-containing protein [Candidatus Bipolaricaulota bacterium]|nr:leucine-rich repeat domain-containing protein [Candidatus Bipolaricaulota bacterium]